MGFELTALVILGLATQGWILFALAPLFALGGIGMPALQSITTTQVDADNQGKLQGVLASLVSLSAVFGPLFFSFLYFTVQPGWPGAIWIIGATVYLIALPLMLGIRRTTAAPAAAQ
jgi:DHA1 family tetracycline resistance protein-like MFS transporter